MTRAEIIDSIAKRTGFTKRDAYKFMNAFTDVLIEGLSQGERIKITGFGSFQVAFSAVRQGRNPQTGDAIKIPSSKTVKFKASRVVKEALTVHNTR